MCTRQRIYSIGFGLVSVKKTKTQPDQGANQEEITHKLSPAFVLPILHPAVLDSNFYRVLNTVVDIWRTIVTL